MLARGLAVMAIAMAGLAMAQTGVTKAPSRQSIEDAARDNCEGVSVIVQRCAPQPDDAAKKKTAADPLTKSRAATKAAFDRKDGRSRAAAIAGEKPSSNTPVGDAERLGGVTVTGTADDKPSVEGVLQKALNPGVDGVLSDDGKTITKSGLNGSRYECVAKCVGPACCTEIRALPNPARDALSIGR